MKPYLLILFLAGHLLTVTAQTKPRQVRLPKYKGDPSCVYKPKYSTAQRNQFYPFSITDTIKLVSFSYRRNNHLIRGNTLQTDKTVEIKTLTKDEINNLTDILYNNFYRKHPNYGSTTQCFSPRNAIVFIDKSGHVEEYIIICFHCNNFKTSSDKITLGDDCTEKMKKLRQFFISSKIIFGTDRTIDSYPGDESDDVVVPPVEQ